jgi:hypothetical protein
LLDLDARVDLIRGLTVDGTTLGGCHLPARKGFKYNVLDQRKSAGRVNWESASIAAYPMGKCGNFFDLVKIRNLVIATSRNSKLNENFVQN